MQLLEKLNIYGLNGLEDIIISGLVTGDPVLLIGRHGTAKTLLARRLAQALQLNFIAYDASKALFDDVVGFPNPKSLAEGKVDYIPTPISIWDKEFILIDEISRATPSMQNKWLEIIRSRQLMGKPIPNLKYVFAAMNPPGSYIGSIALDIALAGRFAFIVSVPEVHQMTSEEIENVIDNISEDDAIVLRMSNVIASKPLGDNLKELLLAAQKSFTEIKQKYDVTISEYIKKILQLFLLQNLKLDGRRLGMIKRNILSFLAVKTVKYGIENVNNNIFDYFYTCLLNSLPYEVTGETLKEEALQSIHMSAVKDLKSGCNSTGMKVKMFSTPTLLEMVKNHIQFWDESSELDHRELVRIISEKFSNISTETEVIDVYLAVRTLVSFYQSKNVNCPVDIKRRIVDLYLQLTGLTTIIRDSEVYERIFYHKQPQEIKESEITIDDEVTDIAIRLALNVQRDRSSQQQIKTSAEFFESLKYELKKLLLSEPAR